MPSILQTSEMITDTTGYIQYNEPSSIRVDTNILYDETSLFDVGAGMMGGATDDGQGGCNISFDFLANIDWNLPDNVMGFFMEPYVFDESLFDKADAISIEFTLINDMLINSIMDMGCCDIAKTYNSTMVPFFQFFADTAQGDNLITILTRLAEAITTVRALVEPLECMIRVTPGNPWVEIEVDPLEWIYSFYKESKPFLDRFLSGEFLDFILNPVHNMRIKLQSCLSYTTNNGEATINLFDIGSQQQLDMISKLAVSDGNPIQDMKLPKPSKPVPPKESDYANGVNDPQYIAAQKAYEVLSKKYERDVANFKIVSEEIERQSKFAQDITPSLAVANQTKELIKIHTDGVCGCVADALGLNQKSQIPIPIRTSSEADTKLIGKTISGLTNKAAGTATKDRPKNKPITVEAGDCQRPKTKEAIIKQGKPKGENIKVKKEKVEAKVPNPYEKIPGSPGGGIKFAVNKAIKEIDVKDPVVALKNNDNNIDLMKKSVDLMYVLESKKTKIEIDHKKNWEKYRKKAKNLIQQYTNIGKKLSTLNKNSKSNDEKIALDYLIAINDSDLKAAQEIFDLYLSTYLPFDFKDDPMDQLAISKFIDEDFFEASGFLNERKSLLAKQNEIIEALGIPEVMLDFPPSMDPISIIDKLPIATNVNVDERFYVNYFDAGFVREKGSSSWRNFNPLEIKFDEQASENGALLADRSTPEFIAIFPNDSIGLQANYIYFNKRYFNYSLKNAIASELKDKSSKKYNEFITYLDSKYNYNLDFEVHRFSEEEVKDLIEELSDWNGRKPGKLWIKMQKVDPSVEFNYVMEPNATQFEVVGIDNNDILTMANLVTGGGIAQTIADISNEALGIRGHSYKDIKITDEQLQAENNFKTQTYDYIMNNLASVVPTDIELTIPCTCEGFMCMILNSIIQYVMAALSKMLSEIAAAVARFLIPDWVKDLLLLINDMVKCLMTFWQIIQKIMDIHMYTQDLLDSMRDRIAYYPADPCYIPEDPINDYDPDYYPNEWDSDYYYSPDGGQDDYNSNDHNYNDYDFGEGYIPGGDGSKSHKPDIILPSDIRGEGGNNPVDDSWNTGGVLPHNQGETPGGGTPPDWGLPPGYGQQPEGDGLTPNHSPYPDNNTQGGTPGSQLKDPRRLITPGANLLPGSSEENIMPGAKTPGQGDGQQGRGPLYIAPCVSPRI
jgi:hypothetical protein